MKRHAPATQRNRGPILDVIKDALPPEGTVLEIASGTGEHALFFAENFPNLIWQPTDGDPASLPSIAAWRDEKKLSNLLAPLHLDVRADRWPIEEADAIFCANMVHISPWETTLGLLDGASRSLKIDMPLILYGPYRVKGVPTAPSNESFDISLRTRNPAWGIRHLEDVLDEAHSRGLSFERTVQMPANNLIVIFTRTS